MLNRIAGWLFIVAFLLTPVHAQTALRFLASPYRVKEGDAVTFQYLDQKTNVLNRAEVSGWAWDFDGDGTVDTSGVAATDGAYPNLNGVWYAAFDRSRAIDGVYKVLPRLFVTNRLGRVFSVVDGVTEDVAGLQQGVIGADGLPADIDRDAHVEVVEFVGGNPDIKATFGTAQRLVLNNTPVRFLSQIDLLKSGRINSIDWDFNGGTNFTVVNVSSPTNTFPTTSEAARYSVSMRVRYQVKNSDSSFSEEREILRTLPDCVRVVPTLENLSMGRAYRRGFPEQYDWDDLVQTYSAQGADGDRHVYYHFLERALIDLQQQVQTNVAGPTESQKQLLAEMVNEVLQGQLLIGNQRLINALRIKYPRITDPNAAEERLPAPPGVREETAAIDVALLDYQAGLFHISVIFKEFGVDLLRSKAVEGQEPFPDFPRYITFEDPSLGQKPIPIKNEWWQLTTCLNQLGLGQVEKAKKLFRLSIQDPTARAEAKQECKHAGLQGYMGLALLAAGQSTNDFALNEGNSLLAHVKNARDLFETINAGLNPLRNDGSFIPNESFGAIYQDAQESVGDAKSAELEARNEKREFDQRQSTLRSELLSQRASYITPLKLLTGIDPVQYNNLQTVQDQNDFRATVRNRIQNILRDYPNTSASGAGELGGAVLGVLDSMQGMQQRINNFNNIFRRIDIAKWRDKEIHRTTLIANNTIRAIDFAVEVAEGMKITQAGTSLTPLSAVAGALLGQLKNYKDIIREIQQFAIDDIGLRAEIKGILLEQGNAAIEIERARNQLDQSKLALENAEQRMDRLIEDLAHTRATAENLYFTDPSFRVVVSRAQHRAEAELDFAVDRLYRLAKTLQYEWTEPYQNPLVIPALSLEPAALENPLFDKFTQLDSVFNIRSADESKDYLDALKAWDSKMRRINVISVRGPNHSPQLSSEPISLREQVFNFKPMTLHDDAGNVTYSVNTADTVRQFREFLQTKRIPNPQNPANDSLELKFATTIEDNRFFPATGTEWNMRIGTIRVDLVADNGFSGTQVAEVDLTQSGIVTLRRFFAEPPAADDLFQLTFNTGNRIDRSAFTIKIPSRINGATGGRPPTEFDAPGLSGRPVAATEWILRIDTSKPANRTIDFTKLKDIVLRFTYTYGNPPEFTGF